MDAKDWIALAVGVAGIGTSIGLGISNSIDQDDSAKKQSELTGQQKKLSARLTSATENIEALQAKATVVGVAWSVDDPVDTRQLVIENRSNGGIYNSLIQLRETRSQTSAVRQYLWIGTISTCTRVKIATKDGVQPWIENFNRGSFVFESDSGFWSRPYTSGLVFLKARPSDITETAKDISKWTTRKEEAIVGCS